MYLLSENKLAKMVYLINILYNYKTEGFRNLAWIVDEHGAPLFAIPAYSFRLDIGFRKPFVGLLIDNGSMYVVVRDWINS
jgi:hypothetical protein